MSRYPPLSPKAIAELWRQSNRSSELHRAIWEIHRLQQVMLVVDQFLAQVQAEHPCMPSETRYRLHAILDEEPAVRIERARRARAARQTRRSLYAGGQVDDADLGSPPFPINEK